MRLFKHFAALALLLFAAAPVCADIALPRNNNQRPAGEIRSDLPFTRMTIERVEGLREARLQIPRAQLERLNAAAGVEGGGSMSASFKTAGTIMGGLFISLAVVLTGLLLLRSRRRVALGRATAALFVCACAAGVAGVVAYANAPAPRYRVQSPGTLVRAVTGAPLAGSIRIEVVEGGDEVKLLVPAQARSGRGDEEEE